MVMGLLSKFQKMDDPQIYLCKEKWPFEDKSCNEVYSSHSFEHFPNTDFILNEAHRVLKSDRLFKIIVPYANSAEGMYPVVYNPGPSFTGFS